MDVPGGLAGDGGCSDGIVATTFLVPLLAKPVEQIEDGELAISLFGSAPPPSWSSRTGRCQAV